MPRCPRCRHDNPAESRFCGWCASPLEARSVPDTRKVVTALFCDLVGSTELGERLDPEAVREVMATYYDRVRSVLDAHGGTVEKFIGDAVMAVFGVPLVHEDDALRAVRAACGTRDAVAVLRKDVERDYGVEVQVRIGVATGEAVTGGGADREAMISGDVGNLAARLEQAASPGEILISAPTYELVRAAAVADPVAPLSLKGKREPVPAFQLRGVIRAGGGWPRLDTPMVDREEELRQLRTLFEGVDRSDACVLVTVVGSAGVGKSRLVREFIASLEVVTVLEGRCLAYGEGITYWPIVEIVSQFAQLSDLDTAEEIRGKIARLCTSADEAPLVAERVAQLVGVSGAQAAPEETFWAVKEILAAASSSPLVVVIEDLHWAEPTLLDLIEYLSRNLGRARLLVVATARHELLEERPSWGGVGIGRVLTLGRLPEAETDELVGQLLGAAAQARDLRDRVSTTCEGNPLFCEQLVASILEREPVEGDGAASVAPSAVPMPRSIAAVLDARLDRLPAAELATLELAAVEGRTFHLEAVTAMAPEGVREGVESAVQSLLGRDLIEPDRATFTGARAFRFRHALVRDAAERRLPKRVAAELHERFADWLAAIVGTRSEGFETFLGYHLERAVRFRREVRPSDERAAELALRAAEHLSASARAAGWRGDSAAATDLLRRAVALRTPDDDALLDDLFELSAAERQHGDAVAETGILDRAEREARRRGLPAQAARAAAGRMWSEGTTDPDGFRPEALRREATEAMALFAAGGDHAGVAQAWSYLGFCDQYDVKHDRMAEDFELAAEEAKIAGQEREALEFRANALVGHYFGWTPVDRGLRLCRTLFRDARDYRYPHCFALSIEGGFVAMRGEFDRARELNGRACAMAEEMGAEAVAHHAGQGRFEIETLAGNLDAVEDVLRQACSLLEEMHDASVGSTFAAYLANTLADLGRFQEAEIEANRAEAMAPESDVTTALVVSRARIKVLAARRDLEAAVAVGRRALRITESIESWDLEAGIRTDLAPVLQLAGLEDEAHRLAAEAVGMYERKGILVLAARARDVLASLSA